jgi:hypothetical protein
VKKQEERVPERSRLPPPPPRCHHGGSRRRWADGRRVRDRCVPALVACARCLRARAATESTAPLVASPRRATQFLCWSTPRFTGEPRQHARGSPLPWELAVRRMLEQRIAEMKEQQTLAVQGLQDESKVRPACIALVLLAQSLASPRTVSSRLRTSASYCSAVPRSKRSRTCSHRATTSTRSWKRMRPSSARMPSQMRRSR